MRVQRWAIFLAAFDYKMEHVSGKTNILADAFSRLPSCNLAAEPTDEEVIEFNFSSFSEKFLSFEDLVEAERKDPVLVEVAKCFKANHWPKRVDVPELSAFANVKKNISIESGVLMLGQRVIVPSALQKTVLQELHSTHLGICKTKSLARMYVWWPNVNKHIEDLVQACPACAENRNNPPKAVSNPWPKATGSWQRIHIDFAGPFQGQFFLLIVDAYSKWPEIFRMANITSSNEFETFLSKNGIQHMTSPPFNPSSMDKQKTVSRVSKQEF